MYEMKIRIRFSDIGSDQKLRLYELPKYFQDISIEHSEAAGVGIPYLAPRSLAWLLTSWQIDIERLPVYNEVVTVRTWPYSFRSSFGYRNYEIIDAEGRQIVKAHALWLHTDIANMKPAVTLPEEYSKYGLDEQLEMEYQPRKITLPAEMDEVDQVLVTEHYADMYQHMNNAMYVDIASDYLPENAEIIRIRVDYRKQVKIGDRMHIRRHLAEDRCYVAFYDNAGDMHVSTEFMIR